MHLAKHSVGAMASYLDSSVVGTVRDNAAFQSCQLQMALHSSGASFRLILLEKHGSGAGPVQVRRMSGSFFVMFQLLCSFHACLCRFILLMILCWCFLVVSLHFVISAPVFYVLVARRCATMDFY